MCVLSALLLLVMFCRVKVWRLWYIPTHTSSCTIHVSKSASTFPCTGANRQQQGGDGASSILILYTIFTGKEWGHITLVLDANALECVSVWQPIKSMAGEADKAMLAGDEPLPQQPLPNKKKNGVSSNNPVVTKKVMIRFKMGKGAGKEVNPKVIQNGLSLSYLSSTSLEDDDKHNLSDAELSPEPSPRSMIQVCTRICTVCDWSVM